MIMADQDQDGSHIKGLVVNFIHSFWPNLLRHDFVEQFITPIVKVMIVGVVGDIIFRTIVSFIVGFVACKRVQYHSIAEQATKKNYPDISFYTLPEVEEWKKKTPKWHTWKLKYYKGTERCPLLHNFSLLNAQSPSFGRALHALTMVEFCV